MDLRTGVSGCPFVVVLTPVGMPGLKLRSMRAECPPSVVGFILALNGCARLTRTIYRGYPNLSVGSRKTFPSQTDYS